MSTKRKIQVRSEPTSYDAEAGTITIVYATATPAQRWGYIEILDMSEVAIDTTRLDAGAVNILLQHDGHFGLPIGNVISHEIVDGIATATFRLSVADEHRGIVSNISAGIYRTWSVGYQIMETEEETREDGVTVVRVTRWMPMEISLVSIPADPESKTRSEERPAAGAIVHRTVTASPQLKGQSPMTIRNLSKPARRRTAAEEAAAAVEEETGAELTEEQATAIETAVETAIEDAVAEVEAGDTTAEDEAERADEEDPEADPADPEADAADPESGDEDTRAASILRLCARHGLSTTFALRHVERGTPINTVRDAILDSIAARSPKPMSNTRIRRDERETLVDRMSDAMAARMSRSAPTAQGREFANFRLRDIARELVGREARNMADHQLFDAAMRTRSGSHSTSDFAAVLSNSANKALLASYELAPKTHDPLVRRVQHTDYKEVEKFRLGDVPKFKRRAEGGEVEFGTMSENAEKFRIHNETTGISFTFETFINDDLGAFGDLPRSFGSNAALREAELVYGILIDGYKMADGRQLFHAQHGNLISNALSIDGLDAGVSAMETQKSLDGNVLGITPKHLVVGSKNRLTAQRLLANITPANAEDVNPFGNSSIQLIVDPRITDMSWFLAADPAAYDGIQLASLAGSNGVQLQTIENFYKRSIDFIASIDLGAAPIDYRPLLKSTGTGT